MSSFASSASSSSRFPLPSLPHSHAHHSHAHHSSTVRERSASSSDEDSFPLAARTSPDLSSLTPSASVPSSPKRAPGLSPSFGATRSPKSTLSVSAPASPSLTGDFSLGSPAVPNTSSSSASPAAEDADESDSEAPITALPGRLPRPKTKLDRERERQNVLNGNAAAPAKREGLGQKLARKRADSLKWAKYANVGAFQVELGLSNEELRRV
ncbi:hypothetical protein JCM8547_006050 [Rhodosporidiobolus lusitaniae]